MAPSVIVTDGNERSALAAARALGAQGVRVIVGAERLPCLASRSKYCAEAFTYPSPYDDPVGFIDTLHSKAISVRPAAIFPMTDMAMRLVCQHRTKLGDAALLPIPPDGAFEHLSDKYRLMQLAKMLQVPIPETTFVPDGVLDEQVWKTGRYPVVIRPAASVLTIQGAWKKAGVMYANTWSELRDLYATHDELKHPSMIQERLTGQGVGLFALMNHGEPVALFAHRRLRERPPSGGVSVLSESIPIPPDTAKYALALLAHVAWHGIAMVEFKIDHRTGQPKLIEVNGRFWGSLQLAIDAGVNFPHLLYRLAVEQEVPHGEPAYRAGVQLRWLLGDLDHLLLRLFKDEKSLASGGMPTRLAAVREFLRYHGGDRHYDVFRRGDPRPFLHESCAYLRELVPF